jgi:hypothetical protein
MVMWGKGDSNSNAPIWGPALVNKKANTANRNTMYGNTSSTGMFAADATEVKVKKGIAQTGWQLRKVGKGSLKSLVVTTPGTGYSNSGVVTVVSETGANASANIVTNGAGAIQSVAVSNFGNGFTSKSPTVSISGGGTGAVLTASAGGRAGRVQFETLVALSSVTGDGTDDTILPDS